MPRPGRAARWATRRSRRSGAGSGSRSRTEQRRVDDRHAAAAGVRDVHARAGGSTASEKGVMPTLIVLTVRMPTTSTSASLRVPLITYAREPSGDRAIAAGRFDVAICGDGRAGDEVDDRHACPAGRPRSRTRGSRRARSRRRARRAAPGRCATTVRRHEVDRGQPAGGRAARDHVCAQPVERQRDRARGQADVGPGHDLLAAEVDDLHLASCRWRPRPGARTRPAPPARTRTGPAS